MHMINWLTSYLGTCAYSNIDHSKKYKIVDVRDILDKEGNISLSILNKIDVAIDYIKNGNKVIVCCDYGMSRSNGVAAGIISKIENISLINALDFFTEDVKEEIKIDIISSVYEALCRKNTPKSSKKNILILGFNKECERKYLMNLDNKLSIRMPSYNELKLTSPLSLLLYCEKHNITDILYMGGSLIPNSYENISYSLKSMQSIMELLKNLNHVRLTYLSERCIYEGYRGSRVIVDESTPLNPKGLSGNSLYLCSQLFDIYINKYDIKAARINLAQVYGYKYKPRFVYNFIDKAMKNQEIVIHQHANGLPFLNFLHMSDFISAMDLWFEREFDMNSMYLLSSDQWISSQEIAEQIIIRTKSKSTINVSQTSDNSSNIFMDSSRFRNKFNWKPNIDFYSHLTELIRDYNEY